MTSEKNLNLKIQEKILKDCGKFHEASKLKLWSFKADLLDASQKKEKVLERIVGIEYKCKGIDDRLLEYEYELEYITETIGINSSPSQQSYSKPWKIVLDISSGICKLLGLTDTSWDRFTVIFIQYIAKNPERLKEYLKSFDPSQIDDETYNISSNIIKKHGLANKLKDSKVPEDFTTLSSWFQTAFYILELQKSLQNYIDELKLLNSKFNQIYLMNQEIQKNIETVKDELEQCGMIMSKCLLIKEKILEGKKSKEEVIASELVICEKMLKTLKGGGKERRNETPVSNLADSLFVSYCYSPDPKILEYKQYYEDSFVELPTQKGNTVDNTITESTEYRKHKPSSKKRCCGLRI